MRDDAETSSSPGGNVRVYERPSRWSMLAPLVWIIVAAAVLVIVLVLIWRQS